METFINFLVINSNNYFIYIIVCSFLLSFGFPAWIISLTSGFLYNFYIGFIFIICINLISSLIGYIIGVSTFNLFLLFHSSRIKNILNKANHWITKHLSNTKGNLFLFALLVKVNPVIPFAMVPIIWGFSLKRSPVLLFIASSIGSIPLGILWCLQGLGLRGIIQSTDLFKSVSSSSDHVYLYVFLTVISSVLILIFNKKIHKQRTKKI